MTDENTLTDEEKENYIKVAKMNLESFKELIRKSEERLEHQKLDYRLESAWIINSLSTHASDVIEKFTSFIEPVIEKKKVN
jgi:hypothetical protein